MLPSHSFSSEHCHCHRSGASLKPEGKAAHVTLSPEVKVP